MIVFNYIEYKNILSTGNAPIRFELDKHSMVCLSGKNGSGKSTLLTALCFGLFGKTFREVNKPQLVNSINQKNLLVTIGFTIGNKKYKVIRGIKPNIFEIYCDDVLLNEQADTRDYQNILEQQILKLNYKTFTQIVCLGSTSYTPFMLLKPQQRREVIDDILDISIFSTMNALLKQKIDIIKTQITQTDSEILTCESKIYSQKRVISTLEQSNTDAIDSLKSKILANNSIIDANKKLIDELHADVELLMKKQEKYNTINTAYNKATQLHQTHINNRKNLLDNVEFFKTNTKCSVCKQDICDDHKNDIVADTSAKIRDIDKAIADLSVVIDKFSKQLIQYDCMSEINNKNIKLYSTTDIINVLTKQNDEFVNEIRVLEDKSTSNLNKEHLDLTDLTNNFNVLLQKKADNADIKSVQDVCYKLLKDSGIKTAVVAEYLPIINKYINMYLSDMDFYVKFELDDQFNETIKSRNRDIFSYQSFSEGEKSKLNTALMLTWRMIAKLKNSASTNLLILDEILDNSLDDDSLDLLTSILKGLTSDSNLNMIIISHRDLSNSDIFDKYIKCEKRGDFSVIS